MPRSMSGILRLKDSTKTRIPFRANMNLRGKFKTDARWPDLLSHCKAVRLSNSS